MEVAAASRGNPRPDSRKGANSVLGQGQVALTSHPILSLVLGSLLSPPPHLPREGSYNQVPLVAFRSGLVMRIRGPLL